jgi:hypothetical protein
VSVGVGSHEGNATDGVVARPANPAIGKNIVNRAARETRKPSTRRKIEGITWLLLNAMPARNARRSGWCCSFGGWLRPFPGTVTRLQVAGLGYPQRLERPGSLRGDRLGGQADMIAALVEQRYAAYRQPIGALPEHRRAAGPGIRRKAGEIVDGIPALGANSSASGRSPAVRK